MSSTQQNGFSESKELCNELHITIRQLLNSGFTKEEAIAAISLSNDASKNTQTNLSSIDTNVTQCLSHLFENTLTGKSEETKLLLKIIQNLLLHATNPKYKDLHYKKVQEKFIKCKPYFDLLFLIGFKQSQNGKRLIWTCNNENMNKLKQVTHVLKHIVDAPVDLNTVVNDNNDNPLWYKYYRINTGRKCDLSQCLCLKTICGLLQLYYYKDTKHLGEIDIAIDISNYNNVHLLNDFNHLLSSHNDGFETIYNTVIQNCEACDLSNCQFMKRNQRNRDEITKKEHLLTQLYVDCHNVLSQQLIDRIHCYYFHSFDIGYRFTNEQRKHINNRLQINKVIKAKQNIYKRVNGLHRLNNMNHKFKTETTTNKFVEYDYGIRFYYWQYSMKNHSKWLCDVNSSNVSGPNDGQNWTVPEKYKSMKEELTNNEIYCIGMIQFEILCENAYMHMESDKVKEMFCVRQETAKCYHMTYRQPISIGHVISMMIYCNYDELQRKFSETFRKLKDETNESLRRKHSNYYHLARFLTESVECFGMQYPHTVDNFDKNIAVFHGVNKSFTFSSMDMHIKGPFSTSTDYSVAVNFCRNKGMILELFIPTYQWRISDCNATNNRLMCLDMQWISDFPNEQEVFCVGGLNKMKCNSIIEVITGLNYGLYVKGLMKLSMSTSTSNIAQLHIGVIDSMYGVINSKLSNQMLFRLISHELHRNAPNHPFAHQFPSCPEYIENILHSHCSNVWRIEMGKQDAIINYFFQNYQNNWVKLDLLSIVFPNLKCINYNAFSKDISWWTQSSIYESVLEFISKNKHSSLEGVYIDGRGNVNHKDVSNYIDTFKDKFSNLGWSIDIVAEKGAATEVGLEPNILNTLRSDEKKMDLNLQNPILTKVFKNLEIDKSYFKKWLLNCDGEVQHYVMMKKL